MNTKDLERINTGKEKPANRSGPYSHHLPNAGIATQFKPGQSGNPNGRPKKIKEAEDILLEALTQAAKTMVGGLLSDDEKIRQAAAKEVIERSMGKAVQTVKTKNEDLSPKEMDLDELEQAYREAATQRDDQAQESAKESH